jgi:hypothetical protein
MDTSGMSAGTKNAQQAAQDAHAEAVAKNAQRAQESVLSIASKNIPIDKRTYYARIDGCSYVFKDGKKILFSGGEYETNLPHEIEELDALCKVQGQYLINLEPVPCKKSDAQIMQEIGASDKHVITGHVSSAGLLGMVR